MISFPSECSQNCNPFWEICISANWPLSTPPDLFVPRISNPQKQERKFIQYHSHNMATTNVLVVLKQSFEEKKPYFWNFQVRV